jgi:hypothetical protein
MDLPFVASLRIPSTLASGVIYPPVLPNIVHSGSQNIVCEHPGVKMKVHGQILDALLLVTNNIRAHMQIDLALFKVLPVGDGSIQVDKNRYVRQHYDYRHQALNPFYRQQANRLT